MVARLSYLGLDSCIAETVDELILKCQPLLETGRCLVVIFPTFVGLATDRSECFLPPRFGQMSWWNFWNERFPSFSS